MTASPESPFSAFFRRPGVIRWITIISLVLSIFWFVRLTDKIVHSPASHLDFRTYHAAAKVYHDGGDPYNFAELVRMGGDSNIFWFVYPPQSLPLIAAWSSIPLFHSGLFYVTLELLAIIMLLLQWKKYLAGRPYAFALLIIFLVLGFHKSLGVEINAGNINLFTIALLWCGFAFFLGRQYAAFTILVFCASLFKQTEILFLSLLLLPDREGKYQKRLQWFGMGVLCFALYHLIGYFIFPQWFGEWLQSVNANSERGKWNPSALAVIDSVFFKVCKWMGLNAWGHSAQVIYVVYAIAVIILTIRAIRRSEQDRIFMLMLVIFAYAVVLPRFKDYSYILLIGPSAWVILTKIRSSVWKAVLILAICVTAFDYQPFVIAFALYVYLMYLSLRNPEALDAIHSLPIRHPAAL